VVDKAVGIEDNSKERKVADILDSKDHTFLYCGEKIAIL